MFVLRSAERQREWKFEVQLVQQQLAEFIGTVKTREVLICFLSPQTSDFSPLIHKVVLVFFPSSKQDCKAEYLHIPSSKKESCKISK